MAGLAGEAVAAGAGDWAAFFGGRPRPRPFGVLAGSAGGAAVLPRPFFSAADLAGVAALVDFAFAGVAAFLPRPLDAELPDADGFLDEGVLPFAGSLLEIRRGADIQKAIP